MRTERLHILLEPDERERFARAAERCGESLSAWLRRAGRERIEREEAAGPLGVAELRELFAACEALDDGTPEPDWDEHRQVIARSRGGGASDT